MVTGTSSAEGRDGDSAAAEELLRKPLFSVLAPWAVYRVHFKNMHLPPPARPGKLRGACPTSGAEEWQHEEEEDVLRKLYVDYYSQKYERDAGRNWERFYKKHQDKFFKDRHYLHVEFPELAQFASEARAARSIDQCHRPPKSLLEVGCGPGNTVYPLRAEDPQLYVHCCDFAPHAIAMVKHNPQYDAQFINAFTCDVTCERLTDWVDPKVDVVTLFFVLSAMSHEGMKASIRNVASVLKPGGHLFVRDYAAGDLAQRRLQPKSKRQLDHSAELYVRGDGTRAFYFSEERIMELFACDELFTQQYVKTYNKTVINHKRQVDMERKWIQAHFIRTVVPLQSPRLLDMVSWHSQREMELHLQRQQVQERKAVYDSQQRAMIGSSVRKQEQ